MTLIVGVNTSEAIYLAADTRVTITTALGVTTHRNDLLKVGPLGSQTAVAVAGDMEMTGYLATCLATEPGLERADVRLVRARAEEVIRAAADRFYRGQRYQGRRDGNVRASLLIGGINPAARKRVRRARLAEVLDAASRRHEAGLRTLEKAANTASDLSTGIALARALAERKGRGLRMTPALSAAIAAAPDDEGLVTLPSADSHVFSVSITPGGLAVEDAEWGEGLVRGATEAIRRDVAPNDLMAAVELAVENEAQAHFVIEILETAKRHGNVTIGGGVVTMRLTEQGQSFGTSRLLKSNATADQFEGLSETSFDGKDLFVRDGGELRKLIRFSAWRLRDGAASDEITLA